jgi:hypothetical protein
MGMDAGNRFAPSRPAGCLSFVPKGVLRLIFGFAQYGAHFSVGAPAHERIATINLAAVLHNSGRERQALAVARGYVASRSKAEWPDCRIREVQAMALAKLGLPL